MVTVTCAPELPGTIYASCSGTPMKKLLIQSCLALLWCSGAAADERDLATADAFLRRHCGRAACGLSAAEKTSLGQALRAPRRTVDDRTIAGLVNNPVAWHPGPDGRQLLRSVITALPHVATIPGAGRSLANATHPNTANFRGFGFEAIASAALSRYREPNGSVPRVLRMSAEVCDHKGKKYESDGCAVFSGADRRQRLVTMKSIGAEKALGKAVHKAMLQLAKRNGSLDRPGEPGQPGILMLGYSDPQILATARRKDWGAAATRSGAKLLALAVNQLTGEVTRLASVEPSRSGMRERHDLAVQRQAERQARHQKQIQRQRERRNRRHDWRPRRSRRY